MISNSVLGEKYVMAPKNVMGDQYVKELDKVMTENRLLDVGHKEYSIIDR